MYCCFEPSTGTNVTIDDEKQTPKNRINGLQRNGRRGDYSDL